MVSLFCLLACAGTLARGCNHYPLQEIIQDLDTLSREKTPCAELAVADVFADPKGTVQARLCGASTVLHRTSYLGAGLSCSNGDRESLFLTLLKRVYRNLRSTVRQNCPVSELKQTTLKDFLENLKRIMQKKYLE
uniref:Interleukin-4 n=2 Tax=Chinchilla lanigera TaxID=34839 RepID=A0A8C2VWX2_CHILA